ncbi:MAG: hypothetical protein ABR989_11065 [Candidatus Binatus soli]
MNKSSQVLATLTAAPDGGGSLTFFDSNGKRFMLVGVSDDGTEAGLEGFDGNTLASGDGVERSGFGVFGSKAAIPGFGLGVAGADGKTARLTLGSSLDGTTTPSGILLFDSSGIGRTGIQVNPTTDFVGFYSGIYTPTGSGSSLTYPGPSESLVGNAYDNSSSYAYLYDSSGNFRNGIQYYPPTNFNGFFSQDGAGHNESLIGNAADNSASYALLYDSSGNLRNGIDYYPPGNFNGFFSQDGAGDTLSSVGNFLTTNAGLSEQANESYLSLQDTTGTTRLVELQEGTTTQGGLEFNSGSTTAAGSWGNP